MTRTDITRRSMRSRRQFAHMGRRSRLGHGDCSQPAVTDIVKDRICPESAAKSPAPIARHRHRRESYAARCSPVARRGGRLQLEH